MELEGLIPNSQKTATYPYPDTDQYNNWLP